MKRLIFSLSLVLVMVLTASGQTWYAEMSADTLKLGNSLIERTFQWNGGNLMTTSLSDFSTGVTHLSASLRPDMVLVRGVTEGEDGSWTTEVLEQNDIHPACLKVTVTCSLGTLQVKRVFRIYDDSPAIACDTWLKGDMYGISSADVGNHADRKNIESSEDMKSKPVTALLDQLHFKGQHWHARAVEFWDVTDWNNNLLEERDIIAYRKNNYRGNLLFVRNGEDGNGFFFLKEAPCSSVQLAHKGVDFIAEFGRFMVTGIGVTDKDVTPDKWTRAYSCVTGVYGEGELAALTALRRYQKNIRRHVPERDEMVMMNTWGDRSQDSKVNETFCLQELEKAARLGVSHFQIDDGWQYGKSPNSAVAKGSFKNIWDNPEYWTPDPVKYPRGLKPIVEKGKELGIEIGLWYNPSVQNDFEDWEKDVAAIVGLYRKYGIRIFKIDGLAIPNKKAEENLRRLFDSVLEQTDNAVMFNLDATAGRRGGYHMLNEYGNIFLENRYTDWGNYYPYWTLRNLWMLSRYVPAERIQVEFLNKWRNDGKYEGDSFAPSGYQFEYVFATSMVGQPLAWMEATNLPEEAFETGDVIRKYRNLSADFHSGVILPVGEEPSGRSWTGFQSICSDSRGYMLVYRESTDRESEYLKTWLSEGSKVVFTPVLGHGKSFRTKVERNGEVRFSLPAQNDYVMYKYEIR